MSYGAAAALQTAIYQTLSSDAVVTSLVGPDIYDAVPGGKVPDLFVGLGVEDAVAKADADGTLTRHRVTVSVYSDTAGFQPAKQVAEAVCDALDGTLPVLTRGRLLSLRFDRAKARRTAQNRKRRIDLRFVALIDAD